MPRSEHGPKCHDCGDRLDSYSEEDRSGNQREAAAHDNRGAIELDASRGRPACIMGGGRRGAARGLSARLSGRARPADHGSDFGLAAFSVGVFRSGPRAPGPPVRAPNRSTAGGCASSTRRSKTGAVSGSRFR